jgi:hypothetical protein
MAGGVVFGVNTSTTAVPQIGYLKEPIPVSESIIMLTAPLRPGTVFRIAAPCATSRCAHFDGARCTLAARTVQLLPEAVDAPPPCHIRPNCRWWLQEGRAACLRCPQVLTEPADPSQQLQIAAQPPQLRDASLSLVRERHE